MEKAQARGVSWEGGLRASPGHRIVLARLLENTDFMPTHIWLAGWIENATKEYPFPERVGGTL